MKDATFARIDFLTYLGNPSNLEKNGAAWGCACSSCVPVVQRPRTPPFHGDDTGSNPVGDANTFHKPPAKSSSVKTQKLIVARKIKA